MLLYNVTINIDKDVEDEWISWMKQKHIPDVLSTGFFIEYKIFRLLNEAHNDGVTYSIQYFAHNLDDVETYLSKYAPALAAEHQEKYQNKHVAFRTLLEYVE